MGLEGGMNQKQESEADQRASELVGKLSALAPHPFASGQEMVDEYERLIKSSDDPEVQALIGDVQKTLEDPTLSGFRKRELQGTYDDYLSSVQGAREDIEEIKKVA